MKRLLASVLAAATLAGACWGRAGLERLAERSRFTHELLYLPNGRYLRVVSLGHATLLADLIYLWAIQYYSDYGRSDRYRYVEHVFGNVIAELDPHYVDPYWLGALILIVESHDLDAGLRLLDRGFERNPGQWILPYLAGFECYRVKDYTRAAVYMEKAAQVPGAPAVVMRMKAGMLARAGDAREAIAMWQEVLDDPRSDAGERAIARRQTRDLRVRVDLLELQGAVDRFRAAHGGFPRRLEELVATGLLPSLALDPDGNGYAYDRGSGKVTSPAGRILGSP